jgi:hypothetical protein
MQAMRAMAQSQGMGVQGVQGVQGMPAFRPRRQKAPVWQSVRYPPNPHLSDTLCTLPPTPATSATPAPATTAPSGGASGDPPGTLTNSGGGGSGSSSGGGSGSSDGGGGWRVCGVCGDDCTMVFTTSGLSARSSGTHHCRACGRIVCCACAPAGETIPAEGIGHKQQLRDFRLPLPAMGMLEPQRVCMPCYYSSFLL